MGAFMRWALVTAGLLCAAPAWADEPCHLKQYASLELETLPDGGFGVPVTLAGKDAILMVGIGVPYSYLDATFTAALGANVKIAPIPLTETAGSAKSNGEVTVPDFQLGRISAKNARFLRMGHMESLGPAVGMLALDILSGFDVELDLAKKRMNLFAHENCPGNGVYWADTYADIPFTTDVVGHPTFRMELDGKGLTVGMVMGARRGFMSTAAASRLFDITVPSTSDDKSPAQSVHHQFRELKIAGLAVENPMIDIDPTMPDCRADLPGREGGDLAGDGLRRCYGLSDLELGSNELTRLRLYFAFKEKVLYVTPADAHQ